VPRTAQTTHLTPPDAARGGGGGWWKVLVGVLIVGGLLAGAALWALNKVGHISLFQSTGCTASSPAGSMDLDLEQAQNAATITAVGASLHMPTFGIRVALATARQESKLHNIGYGDRDSVGLFQQRPSQGWGTSAQIMDPVYSTTKFYQALLAVPNWQGMALTQAAQAVQHSGAPTAYAQYEQFATVVEAVFAGAAGPGLGCTLDGPTFAAQPKAAGKLLTTRGQSVIDDMRTQFGSSNVGQISGVAADGLSFDLAAPASASGPLATTWEWAYANWAAAQAETLGIGQVSYGGKTWHANAGGSGWQADSSTAASSGKVHVVMVSGS
jgi:hypothetical protein